ncbi:MAG: hypothetical protein LBG59_02740 [Candidatus Peribacteria bacterium]|nr:hypothetical protein [Candidatus Peribacteria bacterium]
MLVACEKEEYLLSDLTPHWTLNGQTITDGSVVHIPSNGDTTLELTVSGTNDQQVIEVFLEIYYLNGGLYKKYKEPIATIVSTQVATSVSFIDEKIGDYEARVKFVSHKMNSTKHCRFIIRIDGDGDTGVPSTPPVSQLTHSFTFNGQCLANGSYLIIPSTTTCYLQLQVSGLQQGQTLPVYRSYPTAPGSENPVFVGDVSASSPILNISFGVAVDHQLKILVGSEVFLFYIKVKGTIVTLSEWVQLQIGEEEISSNVIYISQNTYLELIPKKSISKMVVFQYEDESTWSGEFFGTKGYILFNLVYERGRTRKLIISTDGETHIEIRVNSL